MEKWYQITSIIFALISSAAILVGFIWWLVSIIFKDKNLKLWNKYTYLDSLVPLNKKINNFKDNFAGYSVNLNSNDDSFKFFKLNLIRIANKRLKIAIKDIEDFLEAYKKLKPDYGKYIRSFSPFDSPIGFMDADGDILMYKLSNIALEESFDGLMFLFDIKKEDLQKKLNMDKKYCYLGTTQYILLPGWTVARKDKLKDFIKKFGKEPNCVIDNNSFSKILFFKKRNKYPVISWSTKWIGCPSIDDYYQTHRKKFEREMKEKYGHQHHDFYPNFTKNHELFEQAALKWLEWLGFIKIKRN